MSKVFDWVLVSSLSLFIGLAFLAVPFLAMGLLLEAILYTLHLWGIPTKASSSGSDHGLEFAFAGIVISLLLCIGLRTGAFDYPRKRKSDTAQH